MTHDAATPVRPPLARLSVSMVVACVAAAGIGAAIGTQKGLGVTPGLLSLGASLPGVIVSLLLLKIRPAQPAGMWAVPVIAGSMVRAFLTLIIALGILFSMDPDRALFLLTVLGALLVCLAIEVGVVLTMVNTRDAAQPASLEGARS